MQQLFDFDPADYSARYSENGYVHIPAAINEEFYNEFVEQVESCLAQSRLENFALGNKQQSLYEFPEEGNCFERFLDMISTVTGLDREKLILSERHIKAYEDNAVAYPEAHKDRFASEVSVGIAVKSPEASRLVLYPGQELGVNPFNSWAEFREGLPENLKAESVLDESKRVEINDSARDLILFRGHAIWHMRENPAGATMVYLKLNTFNCDPLGEDPRSAALSETDRLEDLADEQFKALVPKISRRVDHIARRYNHTWQEVIGVTLWGQPFQVIDTLDLKLLHGMDGERTVSSVLEELIPDGAFAEGLHRIRDLAERGIVELDNPAENSAVETTANAISADA